MGRPMQPERMQSWIAGDDLQSVARCGVALANSLEIAGEARRRATADLT
jgi:hypothetical protein